jgi:glutathionylspermidine synthase
MTVDEALDIVEVALDYQALNKVQELVFRKSWEGRSYIEIAKSNGYESDYIKDAGAKLWKLLSKALEEKVKKDNLKSVLKLTPKSSERTAKSDDRS